MYAKFYPECRQCDRTLDDTATVVDTYQPRSGDELHHIITCGRYNFTWKVVIDYGNPTITGMAVSVSPASRDNT